MPVEVQVAYAAWFREKTGVASNGLFIANVDRDERNNFVLTSRDGRQSTARRVVVATGHMPFMHVPQTLRTLAGALLAHTAQLHDLSGYAGRDVTVVGAGQSALETAALLVEAGAKVRVVCRRDIFWNPPAQAHRPLWRRIRAPESGLAPGWRSLFYSELPALTRLLPVSVRHRTVATKLGPAGTAWLFDRLNNKAELLPRRSIVSAQTIGDRARLVLSGPQGTETIETDAVITGTGFKADIDRLTMLGAEGLRAQIVREGVRAEAESPGVRDLGAQPAHPGHPERADLRSCDALHVRRQARRAHGDARHRGTDERGGQTGSGWDQRRAGRVGGTALELTRSAAPY